MTDDALLAELMGAAPTLASAWRPIAEAYPAAEPATLSDSRESAEALLRFAGHAISGGHMYTLWRNGVQLGRLIHVKEQSSYAGAPLGLTGVLFPLTAVDDLRTVRQTRFASLPGSPAVQEFPEDAADTPSGPGACVVPIPAFMLLGRDGSGAVPPEAIFTIRTDAGVDVPSHLIEIDRQELPPDVGASELRAAGLPEDLRSVFGVRVVHEEEAPSPQLVEAAKQVLRDLRSLP